jgi:hypothetical protein
MLISSKPTSGPEQFPDCSLNASGLLGALRPETANTLTSLDPVLKMNCSGDKRLP